MTIRHTRRAPLATLIAVAALAMGASSASAADGPPPKPDPRAAISGIWDIERDGYADATVSAAGGSRPFWPAAFEQVLA